MGTLTLDDVILEISPDPDPVDPRTWDNLGRLICWHRRYRLGDPHDYPTPQDFLSDIHHEDTVMLSVYLFDHSGLTLDTSCERFRAIDPAGWDWAPLGFIYALKAGLRREYGVKHLSRKTIERVREVLRGEVTVYDQYLNGDVYGYCITDRRTGEVVGACAGFYGENPHRNGMAEHFPAAYRAEILSYFYRGAA